MSLNSGNIGVDPSGVDTSLPGGVEGVNLLSNLVKIVVIRSRGVVLQSLEEGNTGEDGGEQQTNGSNNSGSFHLIFSY